MTIGKEKQLGAIGDIRVHLGRPAGYLELLRNNRDFRKLWLGQVISELGDWFAAIALLNVMLELTGRAKVLAWFFIVVHIPSFFAGPFSGVLVDRVDRKKLMIAMDLVRAVLVLGYLLVRRADQIWMIYTVATLEVLMSMLFEPARAALIPSICARRELVAANALGSITWSTMLTLGAVLGGAVAAIFGRNVCYVVDALSFLASAFLISTVRLPAGRPKQLTATGQGDTLGLRAVLEGLRYVTTHGRVSPILLVKTGWCLGSGLLLVLSIFGEKIFPVMGSGAAGIGVLFAARGIGTALGPVFACRIVGEKRTAMRHAISVGFLMGSVFYILFGQSPALWMAAAVLFAAHMGGSITWVFSTVLLQLEVPDELRGRIFAIELALLTLAIAVSNYVTGYLLDTLRLDARAVATLLGLYFLVPAALWRFAQRVHQKDEPR